MPREAYPDPNLDPSPTMAEMLEDRDVVTVSVVASSDPTTTAVTTKSSFPVAIAIPALVGGMVLAVALFGLWYWISKRRKREHRMRWEAAQRHKARQRANTAPTRPSASSSRKPSGPIAKAQFTEKEHAPPVPVLAKTYDPQPKMEYGYGYAPELPPQQSYNPYPVQPTIEHDPYATSAESSPTSSGGLQEQQTDFSPKPSRPSRSTARIAAAESAAARAVADPIARHKPNKPSPLALKAEQKAPKWGEGPFRSPPPESDNQEHLTPDNHQDDNVQHANRQAASGEWGVALGSPTGDGFGTEQHTTAPVESHYTDDPYLSHTNNRVPSGQYSTDPYAVYHGEPPVPLPPKTGGWV
ncbi:hypothetical protein M231_00684 [Tremella mesenterica]|uniref:Transmembrane protein n=1 Tax=Tremella mesenterica TaxID=5217 RepID=A0A4Q1BUZ4_TREME|nr:hypothetical protein M231_00684 [Tremella mesenterica]